MREEYPNAGTTWVKRDIEYLIKRKGEGFGDLDGVFEMSRRLGRSPFAIECQINKLITEGLIPTDVNEVPAPSTTQTKKEITMNFITKQTLLLGKDITTYTTNELFDVIRKQEDRIARLESLNTKPDCLLAELAETEANIDRLVAWMNKHVKKN